MTRPILAAFKCIAQEPTSSRMFTVGKTYHVHDPGIKWNAGCIRDDLSLPRFIGESHTFIVENNSELGRPKDIRRAYFVPIYTPEPAQ